MGCSQGVLIRGHAQREEGEGEGRERGSLVGRTVVAWLGAVALWCERPSGEYNPLVACVRGLLGWPPSGPWSGRGLWVVARAGGNTRWWRQVPKAGGEQN